MKNKSIAIVCLLILSLSTSAQKIKYKDLFPILNAKNYTEGGPQLVQYLLDPKNQEDANANLQMALMLEDRFLKYDVVDDTSRLYETGDSSIVYFDRAKSLIDEKELKKNDEYYQVFFRRDLRTGDFGIKVSDVHLDIEKKTEAIQKRSSDAKSMHQKLNSVETSHKKAQDIYQLLTQKYSDYNQLLLSADAGDQSKLSETETFGREASKEALEIRELAKNLGTEKYQGDVALKVVQQFGVDGLTPSSIQGGTIALWDFETWAREAQSTIRGSVGLFKTMIANYSKEIREKKAKVKNSQDVDIANFPSELEDHFSKYDPQSTVRKLLRIEMYEAKVIKHVDLQINPALMDSSLIGSQLLIYSTAKANVDSMNLLVESITEDDLRSAKIKYPDYIDSFFQKYGTASKYVQDMRDWSRRNKEWIGSSVEYWTDKSRWGISGDRTVPLFIQDAPESGFYTMGVVLESIPEIIIYGADLSDKKGYVSSYGEDRLEKWKLDFPLPGTEAFQYETDTLPTARGAVSFYVYNKNASENNFTAVSFSMSGTLNWAANVTIPRAPEDFKFDDLTQELTILLYPEEKLPLDSDELGYIVIDRTGNAR